MNSSLGVVRQTVLTVDGFNFFRFFVHGVESHNLCVHNSKDSLVGFFAYVLRIIPKEVRVVSFVQEVMDFSLFFV